MCLPFLLFLLFEISLWKLHEGTFPILLLQKQEVLVHLCDHQKQCSCNHSCNYMMKDTIAILSLSCSIYMHAARSMSTELHKIHLLHHSTSYPCNFWKETSSGDWEHNLHASMFAFFVLVALPTHYFYQVAYVSIILPKLFRRHKSSIFIASIYIIFITITFLKNVFFRFRFQSQSETAQFPNVLRESWAKRNKARLERSSRTRRSER